jgi:hypothetical protein
MHKNYVNTIKHRKPFNTENQIHIFSGKNKTYFRKYAYFHNNLSDILRQKLQFNKLYYTKNTKGIYFRLIEICAFHNNTSYQTG